VPEIPARRPRRGRLLATAPFDAASRRVLGLVALMLGASAGLWFAVQPNLTFAGHRWLPWWALGALFAAAEVFVLHIQVRREARTISLSDIALVIGLFLATPGSLVLGRLVLPLLVFVFVRRQPLLKVLFNFALQLVEVLVAIVVFGAIVGPHAPDGPLGWLAGAAAAGAGGTISAGLVTAVIALSERQAARRDVSHALLSGLVVAVLVAVPALVSVEALSADRRAVVLLAICASVIFVAYRAYAALNERHLGLERLYEFSRVIGSSQDIEDVVRSLLGEAKDVLHAEKAILSLIDQQNDRVRISLGDSERLAYEPLDVDDTTDWVWARVVGEGEALLLPRTTRDVGIRRYLDRHGWREALVVPMRGESAIVGTLTVADRLGDVRTFDDADARLLGTIANQASIALENGRLIDRLRHDALHDALTGLPNRLMFRTSLVKALEAAGPRTGVAAMILDLDGFKEINDTLGHQYGDVVLSQLAKRLQSVLGDEGLVARLGGDEFAVLLEGLVDDDVAIAMARCLVRSLEEPVHIENMNLEVGGSVGISLCFEEGFEESTLLKQADLAMYAAKTATARVTVFEPSLDSSSPERLALLSGLRQAIADGELIVYVQPKARVDSRRVDCVEALVRWQHPVHGLVMPDSFVPLAERSGLIRPLTSVVLRTAIRDAARWQRAGNPVGIAVNISARSLLDPELANEIEHLLAMHRLSPEMLTLEITESSIMTDQHRTLGLLARLSAIGVRLSVDDFGTGYSSLTYLKRLPVDEVKIDRSFIASLCVDASDAAIGRRPGWQPRPGGGRRRRRGRGDVVPARGVRLRRRAGLSLEPAHADRRFPELAARLRRQAHTAVARRITGLLKA
jgi:diguanylate cyclase (GGDEF)-like protein